MHTIFYKPQSLCLNMCSIELMIYSCSNAFVVNYLYIIDS